jgi:hypothetical protein
MRGCPPSAKPTAQVAAEFAAEVDRFTAPAAGSLGRSGADLQTVELAIRTAMTRRGPGLLQQLMCADTGHRGQRIDCGAGHHAEFVGYRDKNIDTGLGRIVLRRAYYHYAACRRGIVPRDEDLGVAAVSLLPGLRRMTARAAAAEPFATAAELLAELAGIQLSDKRIERSAETNGAAAAEHITAEAEAITHRTVAVLPAPADRGKPPDKLYIAIDLDREGWCRYDRPLLVQPITPDDIAGILAEVATGEPQGRYVDVAGPETQDLVDTARRTNEVRGRKVKRVRTWSGIFGGSMAGNVLLPGEDARIAPTTFDDRLAAGAR